MFFLFSLHPPPHRKINPRKQQGWIEEALRTPKGEISPSLIKSVPIGGEEVVWNFSSTLYIIVATGTLVNRLRECYI